jgi:hypothetical protein
VLMHVGTPSERWVCATLVVSCQRWFTRPFHQHHAHQAPQKALPHATHYSAHNLSIQDTFFRLVVWVSIRERTSSSHHQTY